MVGVFGFSPETCFLRMNIRACVHLIHVEISIVYNRRLVVIWFECVLFDMDPYVVEWFNPNPHFNTKSTRMTSFAEISFLCLNIFPSARNLSHCCIWTNIIAYIICLYRLVRGGLNACCKCLWQHALSHWRLSRHCPGGIATMVTKINCCTSSQQRHTYHNRFDISPVSSVQCSIFYFD